MTIEETITRAKEIGRTEVALEIYALRNKREAEGKKMTVEDVLFLIQPWTL